MRLTQILLRKRKMNTKPQSFVRNWQWNNAWYLNQERMVKNFGMKEALEERSIPVYQPEEVISSYLPREWEEVADNFTYEDVRLKSFNKDESHPFWQDVPVYTYNDKSWQPRDEELKFAQAVTNSICVPHLPSRVLQAQGSVVTSPEVEGRVARLLNYCFMGDAVQKKLPRNFKVPYIGWHPVESKMRPRNQYNYEAFSWGWRMPREYGIPNVRKIQNLTRGLFTEITNNNKISWNELQLLENSKVVQFVSRPDDKLLRFVLEVPFAIVNSKPLAPYKDTINKEESVPRVSPLNPVAGMLPTNIYENRNSHPILSANHSHPNIDLVGHFYTSHIAPNFKVDPNRAKVLYSAFTAAVGQARLKYGASVEGTLPEPITVNSFSTDGRQFLLGTLQLNTLDLGSTSTHNIFYSHPQPKNLMEFCGYREAKPCLEGLNMDTYALLEAFFTQGVTGRT